MKRSRLLLCRAGASRRAAFAILAGVLALAGAVATPGPAEAAPQAAPGDGGGDAARARELFKKGYAEYAKDHLPEAYALLVESFTLQKSYDVAGDLAQVEVQLTRYREAAEHATYALTHFPTGGAEAQRKAFETALADARAHIGAITVQVSVDHAIVSLDGQPVGESPLALELFVEPGKHVLAASAPDCVSAQDTVPTGKGTSHLIILTLRCGTTKPPTQIVPVETGLRPISVTGFAATGLGLGLGAVFAIVSAVKGSDAGTQHQVVAGEAKGNTNYCASSPPSSDCTKLYNLLASQSTFGNASLWSFVAGGAVGLGTVAYTFIVPRSAPAAKPTGAKLVPFAGPGTGGLLLKGAF